LNVCKLTGRAAALVVSAIAMLGIAGTIAIPAASASTGYTATLSASGTNASATCNSDGTFDLTPGTPTSSTYAQADVNGVAGTAVPTAEPTFMTSNFSTGSPRWVIILSNGKNLMNNQASSTMPASPGAADWQVNLNNVNLTYANAVAAAVGTATGVTVKDAFIVADGDQASGTDNHITDATYNGQSLTCAAAAPSPAPTPSSSPSSGHFPKGGVQTGGGKPVTSPWVPFGIVLAGIATLLAGTAGAVALRKQRG
jgi:hypothetical protein